MDGSRRTVLAGLAAAMLASRARAGDAVPVIAVAASLRLALDDIAAIFERTRGEKIRLTYGATGTLVTQIENGAPFELLLAADQESPARLAAAGLTRGAPRALVRGRLSLVGRQGGRVAIDSELEGLKRALASGTLARFAIANPELAPYGRAAREVLTGAGLWDQIAIRLAVGENVGQAAQFVLSGGADAGLIAHSLALAPAVNATLARALIAESRHRPIVQDMVVLKRAGGVALAFADFLAGAEAAAVLARHGFSVPGST